MTVQCTKKDVRKCLFWKKIIKTSQSKRTPTFPESAVKKIIDSRVKWWWLGPFLTEDWPHFCYQFLFKDLPTINCDNDLTKNVRKQKIITFYFKNIFPTFGGDK